MSEDGKARLPGNLCGKGDSTAVKLVRMIGRVSVERMDY